MKKVLTYLLGVTTLLTCSYGQTTWYKYPDNPIFSRGVNGTWDDAIVASPQIVYKNEIYHMWYQGYDGNNNGSRVGYAYSLDGIIWTRHTEPVLDKGPGGSWDNLSIWQPCVIMNDTINQMWYSGLTDINNRFIGYATSQDSINWTKHPDNPVLEPGSPGDWDDEWIDSPEVLKIDSVYHMWYAGNNGTHTQIGHATSDDGVTWVKDTLNPVLTHGTSGSWDNQTVEGPSVLFDEDMFYMWYSGGEELAFDWKVGYATSADGRIWTKESIENPVLDLGALGSWDDTYVGGGGPEVMFGETDNEFRMWYDGGPDELFGDIGYALTTPFAPTAIETIMDKQSKGLLLKNYPNPFTEETVISYNVPELSNVTLKVYDLTGRDIVTLVREIQTTGEKSVIFPSGSLSSGVYMLQLKAGSFNASRSMIIIP